MGEQEEEVDAIAAIQPQPKAVGNPARGQSSAHQAGGWEEAGETFHCPERAAERVADEAQD
jgi:hypothetical protein